MEPFDPNTVNTIELLLVGRALLYALVFFIFAWLAFATNNRNHLTVKVAGVVSLVLGIVNIVIAVEWINLFYF